AVENMNIGRQNVDMIKKVFAHPAMMALKLVARQAVEFIQYKGDCSREIEPFFAVHPHQLAISTNRRAPGRQSEDSLLPQGVTLANDTGDNQRHVPCEIIVRIKYVGRKPCSRSKASPRSHGHSWPWHAMVEIHIQSTKFRIHAVVSMP